VVFFIGHYGGLCGWGSLLPRQVRLPVCATPRNVLALLHDPDFLLLALF
jgi:hypothetical protein